MLYNIPTYTPFAKKTKTVAQEESHRKNVSPANNFWAQPTSK